MRALPIAVREKVLSAGLWWVHAALHLSAGSSVITLSWDISGDGYNAT